MQAHPTACIVHLITMLHNLCQPASTVLHHVLHSHELCCIVLQSGTLTYSCTGLWQLCILAQNLQPGWCTTYGLAYENEHYCS